ncbi:hypothetical protein I6N96_11405 [Enterococcus sp. BWM-S5]|uniref:Uncharacterized protein n=1 Tax=Enterococcus larvae TaxID=2794352 RepID=A0ABS4CJT5_9ENTE|nr:hypothetical protein [Enterococcus larvae]MBP1046875.1 hypothetical protein [Enterococcus larvae]
MNLEYYSKKLGKHAPFVEALHENNQFDIDLFEQYLANCRGLIRFINEGGSSLQAKELICEIIDIFEYTLLSLYYHLDEKDLSSIKNYEELVEKDYFEILEYGVRQLSRELIMAI